MDSFQWRLAFRLGLVVCLGLWVWSEHTHAQNQRSIQNSELAHRLTTLEGVNADVRLARVETNVENIRLDISSMRNLIIGIAIAIMGQLLLGGVSAVQARRRPRTDDAG